MDDEFGLWKRYVLSGLARDLPEHVTASSNEEAVTWNRLAVNVLEQLALDQNPENHMEAFKSFGDSALALNTSAEVADFIRSFDKTEHPSCDVRSIIRHVLETDVISNTPETPKLASADQIPDAAKFGEWLARTRPDLTGDIVEFSILSNGYSKRCWLVRMGDARQFVIRQDTSFSQGSGVAEEAKILSAIESDLPIPAVLHLEENAPQLGEPFLLMSYLKGHPLGDWFGNHAADNETIKDVARILARLHSIPLEDSPISPDPRKSAADLTQELISHYWARWKHATIVPAPIVDAAFLLLRKELNYDLGRPVLVHGDMSPWNFLVEGRRVTALLDWEYGHIGAAAEDLAYVRDFVESTLPWAEFMAAYQAAGGSHVDDRLLRLFDLFCAVRNATLAAGIGRTFLNNPSLPSRVGAVSYLSRISTLNKVRTSLTYVINNKC